MVNAVNLVNSIRNKLELLIKGGYETEITLIKKKGNIEQLGISDIEENEHIGEYKVNVILIIRGSDRSAIGEVKNSMELGNNPDAYLEFIRIFSFDDKKEDSRLPVKIRTSDRIIYKQDEYVVNEILPVILGEQLLFEQYNTKKVL